MVRQDRPASGGEGLRVREVRVERAIPALAPGGTEVRSLRAGPCDVYEVQGLRGISLATGFGQFELVPLVTGELQWVLGPPPGFPQFCLFRGLWAGTPRPYRDHPVPQRVLRPGWRVAAGLGRAGPGEMLRPRRTSALWKVPLRSESGSDPP